MLSLLDTLDEALADPQVAARSMVAEVDHPTVGTIPTVASPFGRAARPGSARGDSPLFP